MSCDKKQFSVELCSPKEDAGDELVGRRNCGRSFPTGISFITDIEHGTYSMTQLYFFGIVRDGRDLPVHKDYIRSIQIIII
ncbi:hypothetical protein NPIL_671531 [Nephila pilipes]|uniref:Uncharacterized protein n=1 Tax=Nephila pilipes TaxID=299642 RepID=A0A8X6TBU1_NEPPI|nr:hypothetical protein NPIL_671531 [Nephila pilipes]